MTDVEISSFGLHVAEISLVKGSPGTQTGGTPSRQSGGHLSPGGECFAPFPYDNKNNWKVGAFYQNYENDVKLMTSNSIKDHSGDV